MSEMKWLPRPQPTSPIEASPSSRLQTHWADYPTQLHLEDQTHAEENRVIALGDAGKELV
jgi:hypothetical protein